MAQAQPVEQLANGRSVYPHTTFNQLDHKIVQRQIAVVSQSLAHPLMLVAQLTHLTTVPLRFGDERTRLTPQDDHVVRKTRRYPEMNRCRPMGMSLIDKGNNTLT